MITVVSCRKLPISVLRSPALPRRAAPTVPGMPTRDSSPANPSRMQAEIIGPKADPPPTRTRFPWISISANAGADRCRTTPGTP